MFINCDDPINPITTRIIIWIRVNFISPERKKRIYFIRKQIRSMFVWVHSNRKRIFLRAECTCLPLQGMKVRLCHIMWMQINNWKQSKNEIMNAEHPSNWCCRCLLLFNASKSFYTLVICNFDPFYIEITYFFTFLRLLINAMISIFSGIFWACFAQLFFWVQLNWLTNWNLLFWTH